MFHCQNDTMLKYFIVFSCCLFMTGCSGNNGNEVTASGTIEGTNINIGTEVSGKITRVVVDEGSRVKAGDTLAVINDVEYRIQLRQSEANLASFESSYKLAVDGPRKEDVVQAEAAFTTAESDYNRMKELLASRAITKKQYEDAYNKYISAQQMYEKLKNGSRREEIDGARQKRELASAQVDLLKKKIHDCVIVAPSEGTVTLRAVEPGELITVGMNIFRLTYLEKVKLVIYVNEKELANVRLGQQAKIRVDGAPNKEFTGSVTYISSVAEFTPKNIQTKEDRTKLVFGVKIEIPNADQVLKPGMPADASLR
jgi:HlyD family secretion protein